MVVPVFNKKSVAQHCWHLGWLIVWGEALTVTSVTVLVYGVARHCRHLGWLIVWGNVFGALIGLLSEAMHLTPEYKCTFNSTAHAWVEP
jgi:hypothetical protein